MATEQVTPNDLIARPTIVANPSGAAGAAVVILHGIADEAGAQRGGAAPLATADAGLGTDGANLPALPGGATGVRGLLRGIWATLTGTLTASIGAVAVAGDGTIAVAGVAQTLFGGVAPSNGWKIANPDLAEDLWVSDSATAAPNGLGSVRVGANGGQYATEPGERPAGPVSVYGATAGHRFTARRW